MIIKDKAFGKYMIDADNPHNFSVFHEVMDEKKGKLVKNYIAHFHKIENCIPFLIKMKMARTKTTVNLHGFLKKYRKYRLEMIKAIRSETSE